MAPYLVIFDHMSHGILLKRIPHDELGVRHKFLGRKGNEDLEKILRRHTTVSYRFLHTVLHAGLGDWLTAPREGMSLCTALPASSTSQVHSS